MGDERWFDAFPETFEESVRVDRDRDGHRERAIRSFHVTADSRRFVRTLLDRTLGRTDGMRSGSNYWLSGPYGSGKSHLLTVLDGLLDTDWLDGRRTTVWSDLVPNPGDTDYHELRDRWRTVHDECHVVPISVNLLGYRARTERSLGEIVLSHAHRNPNLTGVDDDISTGLSPNVDVAYFEKWFRTTDGWRERRTRAEAVLEDVTMPSDEYDWRSETLWRDVQTYGMLADVVLPRLFAEENGTRDGFSDLQPSDIGPETVVGRLEELRAEREAELGTPVTVVLLLDGVGRFVGSDFERLTELQTLAENVDDVGGGDIQLVATARASIEDVQPTFAAHGADFSVVKDRFPHRYRLTSEHVSEIAKRRLLRKTDPGESAIRELLDASMKPSESLVYRDVGRNLTPPLDDIDEADLVEFYPFLPAHASLFLELLFDLRQEASDSATSILPDTARSVLPLMHDLLRTWVDDGDGSTVITLVDLYELIEPELRERRAREVRFIEGSNATGKRGDDGPDVVRGIADEVRDGELEPFDLDVAKAVLLLQHVHDVVPLTEGNIAVSVTSDLDGRSRIHTQNRVEESLDRLRKFVRPTGREGGARYRFATREERTIYDDTAAKKADPNWDAILRAVDEHLWGRIVRDLSLPASVPYGDSDDEYPVTYRFSVDGTDFGTTVDVDGGLDVSIAVEGIRPDNEPATGDEGTLHWSIDTDGLDDLRKHIVEWWALRDAISTHGAPPAVERDLDRRAGTVRRKLVSAMGSGSYTVKDRSDIGGLATAVRTAVDVAYPGDFHPTMLRVTDDRLQELAELSAGDSLPAWAHRIQVPPLDPSTNRGERTIQRNVMALTGRQLTDREDGVDVTTVLDGIVSERPFYDDARPALRAILWGLCRMGRFVPVDADGNTLENSAVLDRGRRPTKLTLLPREPIGKLLEAGGYKETTETVADGLIALRETNRRLRSSLAGLREDVRLVADVDVHSDAVPGLLFALIDELTERVAATDERLRAVRSQDGIREAVEETNEALEWFDEVADVWRRRRLSLQRLDAQLAARSDRFDWIDGKARASLAERRDAIEKFDGVWWTPDGWNALVGETATDPSAELRRSWDVFVDQRGIRDLVRRIDDHPWVVPTTELPTGVHRAFEREFITPLRELQRWYDGMNDAVSSLTEDDEGSLVVASEDISESDSLTDAVGHDVSELSSRIDRLTTAVGDRPPEEVDNIGLLPDDRSALEEPLERWVETRKPEIESTETGVTIR